MTCVAPCLTCLASNFYSCLSCDTTVNPSSVLTYLQCDSSPTWYIQLACTSMLALFIIFPMTRKRSMVLTKLLDIIQTAAYFKYINGFIYYRHNFLYLDMRGVTPWNEGWQLLSLSSDLVTPVFLTQETYSNKLARIGSIWIGTILLVAIVGILKICCRQGKIQFSTYMSKNIVNTLCIAFYVTIQDISFFCAANFYSPNFNSILGISFFGAAVLLAFLGVILIIWQYSIVNYRYEQVQDDKLYNYEVMFMYRMDYDLFRTYSLTNLPKTQKQIFRYSNLGLIDLFKKIGYAFLIVSYLYDPNTTLQIQIYSLAGYILIFQIIWYIAMPFDPKKQLAQLLINIMGDGLLLGLLIYPLFTNSSSSDSIYFIACLALFGLAIFSMILQILLDLYAMIPYDLYNIGLTVIIQDKELLKELKQRKKEQEENERKIKQLRQQHQRLLEQMRHQKENRNGQLKKPKNSRENNSESQINKKPAGKQQNDQISEITNQQLAYPVQNDIDGDDLGQYKIDTKKKRVMYSFNKKVPFAYSNKLDQ